MNTNTQNIDWSKVKICQSCGMPLLEEEHFAKNADGTKNDKSKNSWQSIYRP